MWGRVFQVERLWEALGGVLTTIIGLCALSGTGPYRHLLVAVKHVSQDVLGVLESFDHF